jgi:sulfite reductase (ferredoxin)
MAPLDGKGRESKVEAVKRESAGLRGTIAQGLLSADSHFGDADHNLLKFHGTYQGYDRDSATALKQQGLDKAWEFMVRVKIPGGRLTAAEYLALDDLASRHGGDNLRITTRQGIQYHGITKAELKPTIAAINAALLTTFGACGDVVRNVTATPAPIADRAHQLLQEQAAVLSAALTPRTGGYHEIWVDGALVAGEDEADPLYRDTYLPRKFKIGLATPEDNSVDVLTNDLGIVALFEGERLQGYNLALGGGLGMTHNKPKTYPRLATPLVFVPPDRLLDGVRAVIELQRDHGDRADRKHARLKYVMDEKGLPWVKAELERYFGGPLEPARPMPPFRVVDHMGWHPQGDGRWYLGLPVANGRIRDEGDIRTRSAFRSIFSEFAATPILMATQDILIADVAPGDREAIDAVLAAHGVVRPDQLPPVKRWAMACPALPSCGLALNEAERIRVPLVDQIHAAMQRHGLGDERLSVRITGCPNGCARSYAGDIGIVGRTPNEYALFLGGDFEGTRLNALTFERVPLERIADILDPLFRRFAAERTGTEGFGDWCGRMGTGRLRALAGVAEAA